MVGHVTTIVKQYVVNESRISWTHSPWYKNNNGMSSLKSYPQPTYFWGSIAGTKNFIADGIWNQIPLVVATNNYSSFENGLI